jgi:hypothetical protein
MTRGGVTQKKSWYHSGGQDRRGRGQRFQAGGRYGRGGSCSEFLSPGLWFVLGFSGKAYGIQLPENSHGRKTGFRDILQTLVQSYPCSFLGMTQTDHFSNLKLRVFIVELLMSVLKAHAILTWFIFSKE